MGQRAQAGQCEDDSYLFGIVPADAFRALATRSRHFYARLLVYLADEIFGYIGDSVTRRRALAGIAEFIARQERALVAEALTDQVEGVADSAPQIAYQRLIDTGWLVEYPDRYQKIVDFDPAARLLLQALMDIENGRLRSYGGAVLNVVSLLRLVESEPLEKALAAREAAIAARAFMAHLKTVGSALRQVEAQILEQPSANALIKSFIDDFIQATVIQDYRNLHTRDSPFRFRNEILEIADRLLGSVETLALVAKGYRRAGLQTRGEADIIEDLRSVSRAFSVVDQHVAAIEETTFRIERRILNVVRLSGRISPVDTARIEGLLGRLGASGLAPDAQVGVDPFILEESPLLDVRHLYLPNRRRGASAGTDVQIRARDPALDRYHAALDAFEARVAVTPAVIRTYLDRALGGQDGIDSAALPLETLDDFLIIERIHEVAHPPLDAEFLIEPLPGSLTSEWIDRSAFRIARRRR
jgi:hypothetical protein